jgi:hypothetical protein
MNQKVLVALTIIAIVLGVINLTLLFNPNLINIPFQSTPPDHSQKIPLEVWNIVINNSSDYYVIRVSVGLPDEVQTLFNCYIKVDYLTKNSTWKTITRNIGIVNYRQNPPVQENLRMDGDFLSEIPLRRGRGSIFIIYEGSNVKVEAYGYLKP